MAALGASAAAIAGDRIYQWRVGVKRRATLDPKKAQEIAESILRVGLQSPILVRQDVERFVLVEGLHRLEACKQLGEETIIGYVVQARRH